METTFWSYWLYFQVPILITSMIITQNFKAEISVLVTEVILERAKASLQAFWSSCSCPDQSHGISSASLPFLGDIGPITYALDRGFLLSQSARTDLFLCLYTSSQKTLDKVMSTSNESQNPTASDLTKRLLWSLVIEHIEENSFTPDFPMRTGINVLFAIRILVLCFKALRTERA